MNNKHSKLYTTMPTSDMKHEEETKSRFGISRVYLSAFVSAAATALLVHFTGQYILVPVRIP